MWKVITNSNLNPPLKLFFYLLILTNNNLLLKIYYKNIVVVFFNQDFFFLPFISFSSIHVSSLLLLFSFFFFLFFSSTPLLLFSFSPQEHSSISHLLHMRERERERERVLIHHRWRLRSPKGQSQWRLVFTMQHYHVCRPIAARHPPHHQAGTTKNAAWSCALELCFKKMHKMQLHQH